MDSAAAVLDEGELRATTAAVDAFCAGAGPSLQRELERLSDSQFKGSSYISQPWFDLYLEDRQPVAVNVNPCLWFEDDPRCAGDQALRAASLVAASAAFYRTLRDGHLKPEVFHTKPHVSEQPWFERLVALLPERLSWYGGYLGGAYALDMSQFGRLFASTRIPRRGKDELVSAGSPPTHVVVQRGAAFYRLEALRPDGTAVPAADLAAGFRAILSAPPASNPPMGALTTLPRDEWADARAQLLQGNAASLACIDEALFMVSLDDGEPTTLPEAKRLMLHGEQPNRWFDKSFQLVVAANGKAGVNFEHAWGDGVAVLRYFKGVHAAAAAAPVPSPGGVSEAAPAALPWDVPPAVGALAARAHTDFQARCAALEYAMVEEDGIGARLFKEAGIGTDSGMQMLMQLAHHLLHGCAAATYESASTSGFKHGRTETVRSATRESAELCRAFAGDAAGPAERLRLLRAADAKHKTLVREALMGQGWDRHLFALRLLAEGRGEVAPIFADPGYARMNEIILSTSTLAAEGLEGGGFGPVGDRSYAIGYGHRADMVRFGVMTNAGRGAADFGAALRSAASSMRDTLQV